jgi:hypothetical protein
MPVNFRVFLARFSMSGAVGRTKAGNIWKRGLKWHPAGLMGWKIASRRTQHQGMAKRLKFEVVRTAALGAPAGRGGQIFAMFFSKIKKPDTISTRGPLTCSFWWPKTHLEAFGCALCFYTQISRFAAADVTFGLFFGVWRFGSKNGFEHLEKGFKMVSR